MLFCKEAIGEHVVQRSRAISNTHYFLYAVGSLGKAYDMVNALLHSSTPVEHNIGIVILFVSYEAVENFRACWHVLPLFLPRILIADHD